MIKNSGHSVAVKEDELRKNGKKWKTMKNTSINLYGFFIVIKKLQKISNNFCTDLTRWGHWGSKRPQGNKIVISKVRKYFFYILIHILQILF